MRTLLGISALTLALVVPLQPAAAVEPDWEESVVDATQSFRGLDAVDDQVAWISGEDAVRGVPGPGSVFRTTDGGATWDEVTPDFEDDLMFRDVEARDADTALVLAIGPGEASRVYRTEDGGQTWEETFRNSEEAAFYNCMDFFPGGLRGLAVSDPVDGKFRVISTADGGRTWDVLPDDGMPDSTGEYNFSASGDCLTIVGKHAYFGSGGEASRVFHSSDRGLTWDAVDSTIPAGPAAGVFALAFRSPGQGVAVGGDFEAPERGQDAAAYTRGGNTWVGASDLGQLGEDASWVPRTRGTVLVVGESGATAGSDISHDGGRTWTTFSDVGFHTLDCTVDGSCWAAGGSGRVALLDREL